jgi:hypothetical protein
MSQILAQLLAQANEAAELASIDMSETSSGGERILIPEGKKIGTFVEYIEVGKQPKEYQGQQKTPALTFRLGFAIHNVTPDGPVLLRTFDLSLGNNEKAKSKIAFDRMNYKKLAKHFAQLLGTSYLLEIKIVKGKTAPFKERNEINFATIDPAIEPVSQQPYQIPAFDDKLYRLFLWDVPTKEGWDALHIAGTTDDGKSKNYIQELCLKAVDYPGSALEALLGGGVPDITAPAVLAAEAGSAVPEVPVDIPKVETPAVVSTTPLADVPKLTTVPTIPALP